MKPQKSRGVPMAQLGSFNRAMQPQLRVASCASTVILSIQCVNLHLKVYSELYEFDNSILESIRKRVNRLAFFTEYRELVRMQDDPCFPINFAEPGIYHRPSRRICDNIDEGDIILNFLRHSSVANGEGSMLEVDEDDEYEMRPVDDVLELSLIHI